MIKVLFFASLREQLGCEQLQLETADAGSTLSQLMSHLQQKGEQWHVALSQPSLLMAVNQEMARRTTSIKAGDEVAFFPPVTGG